MFFKSPITQHPQIGKFQKWTEMKVNYPTNKENTQMDFSDNFYNIQNFVQVEHIEKIMKNLIFSLHRSQKPPLVGNIFQLAEMNVNKCQIIV
jgi:hypothetical protein